MEDVHDDRAVVDDDPLADRKTVFCRRALSRGLAHPFPDGTGDRLELGLGGARDDDEEVGETGNPPHVEDHDILGFLIESRLGTESCQCLLRIKGSGGLFLRSGSGWFTRGHGRGRDTDLRT